MTAQCTCSFVPRTPRQSACSSAGDFQVPDLDQFDRYGPRQGLGLGIIIVNRLVEQMKMELLFQSDENVVSFRVSGGVARKSSRPSDLPRSISVAFKRSA